MDDYLSKPVKRQELEALIARAMNAHRSGAEAERRGGDSPSTPMDLEAAMSVAHGDQDLLDELLQTFLRQCPLSLGSLQEAVLLSDPGGVQAASHDLKGALGAIGATTASALAQELEGMGRSAELCRGPTVPAARAGA